MTHQLTAIRALPAVMLASTFALANLGPAQALTLDEIANYKGADRQQVLLKGAKKEGLVMWYTSLIVDQVAKPTVTDFEKKYPGIKVKFIRANSSKLLQRIMTENRAKSVRHDVVNGSIAAALIKAKFVQPFYSPHMADYPKAYVGADRTWVGVRVSWQGIGWNTNLVKQSEAPQTWEALLDPKWKGKLVWAASSNTGAPRMITHWRDIWGEKKALSFLTKLQKQDVRTLPGSIRTVMDQVIAGEAAVGISMAMHHIAISKAKKAPAFGTSPAPVLTRVGTVHLMKGAPHPYAAMLFVDFILDKNGAQQTFRKARYNPGHPAVDPRPEMAWIQPSKIGKKEVIMNFMEVEKMRKTSANLYKTMFR